MASQLCKRINDGESRSELHIPQEITDNILTRLPLKSLIRFESVSKSWCSWIKNPNFQRKDLQSVLSISKSLEGGFFQTTTEEGTATEKFPVPWDGSASNVCISNSCDGMVLICVGKCFYLFNPSTHYFAKVLTLNYMSGDNRVENYHMVIGLYYDEAISDYKAVVLVQYKLFVSVSDTASILVEASLKEKRWNHIQHDHKNWKYANNKFKLGPVVNGRLHWLVNGNIIRFDPVLKVVEDLPSFQPPNDTKGDEIVGIGYLEGYLCVSRTFNYKRSVEILAMKEYGVSESWTRIFSVLDYIEDCNPLLLTKSGEILISTSRGIFSTKETWVYNLGEKSLKKYGISCNSASFVQNMGTPKDLTEEHDGKTEDFDVCLKIIR